MDITPTTLKQISDAALALLDRAVLTPDRERALKRLFNAANLLAAIIEIEEGKGEEAE